MQTSGQQRQLNIHRIYSAIREEAGTNRAMLARRFGLSKPTVSEIARILIESRLVHEGNAQPNHDRGRNPIGLALDPNAYHTISIDLGGTNLRGAIVDLSGCVQHHLSEKTDGDRMEEQVERLITRLIELDPATPVLGIGIGAAGTVEKHTGRIINIPAHNRQDVDLRRFLSRSTDTPILVDNDVNYATIGEWWRGAARQVNNAICVSIGTGVGSGLILDGHPFRGSRNLVGEIGYFFRDQTLPKKPYVAFGAMEHRASGWGICRRAEQALKEGTHSILTHAKLQDDQGRAVFEAAAEGDELACMLVREAGHEIGVAIANVISLLDLDCVVLTGGLMRASEQILSIVDSVVRQVAVPESRELVDIRLGSLGDNAVLIGAGFEVQEAFLPERVMAGTGS